MLQIPLQRFGARVPLRQDIQGPLRHPGMPVVQGQVPDPVAAEERALGTAHLRRHPLPPLAGQGGQGLVVQGVRPAGARVQLLRLVPKISDEISGRRANHVLCSSS